MRKRKDEKTSVDKVNQYIQTLCGLYSRIARRLGVDRSFVSRVAKGERHSEVVEQALTSEFDRIQESQT